MVYKHRTFKDPIYSRHIVTYILDYNLKYRHVYPSIISENIMQLILSQLAVIAGEELLRAYILTSDSTPLLPTTPLGSLNFKNQRTKKMEGCVKMAFLLLRAALK